MTALDSFYDAISNNLVPASVPVKDQQGREGISTQGFRYIGRPQAQELVLSPQARARGLAAIFACTDARKHVIENYDSLTPR